MTFPHVMEMVQILLFTFFSFWVFIPTRTARGVDDLDVLYRKTHHLVFVDAVGAVFDGTDRAAGKVAHAVTQWLRDPTKTRAYRFSGFDPDRSRPPLLWPMGALGGVRVGGSWQRWRASADYTGRNKIALFQTEEGLLAPRTAAGALHRSPGRHPPLNSKG